jgi:hypothetical protein
MQKRMAIRKVRPITAFMRTEPIIARGTEVDGLCIVVERWAAPS